MQHTIGDAAHIVQRVGQRALNPGVSGASSHFRVWKIASRLGDNFNYLDNLKTWILGNLENSRVTSTAY